MSQATLTADSLSLVVDDTAPYYGLHYRDLKPEDPQDNPWIDDNLTFTTREAALTHAAEKILNEGDWECRVICVVPLCLALAG